MSKPWVGRGGMGSRASRGCRRLQQKEKWNVDCGQTWRGGLRRGGTRVAGRGPGATGGATRVMPELWGLEGGTLRLLRGG